MIRLSNGYELSFACGSGALAYDGRGWPVKRLLQRSREYARVVKTLTLPPRTGNLVMYAPWRCIRLYPDGNALNAVNLTNPGLQFWIDHIYPFLRDSVIVSLYSEDPNEMRLMVVMLQGLDKIVAIEVNVSCPNTGHNLGSSALAVLIIEAALTSELPIIIKLGYTQPYLEIAGAVADRVAAVHLINTVPFATVKPGERSPLEHLKGGGWSGPIIRPYGLAAVSDVYDQIPKLRGRIIGGGGINSVHAAQEYRDVGASAYSVGTVFMSSLRNPDWLVRECRKVGIN